MAKINNSFLWGILFASTTWSVSLYLYWALTSSGEANGKLMEHENSGYKLTNYEEKIRIKNNEKALAELPGKNLLYDAPQNKAKLNNERNIWQMKSNKVDYAKRLFMKQQYAKKTNGGAVDPDHKFDDEFGIIRTEEDAMIRDKGYNQHAFNCLVSQRIGNSRNIPDTRNKLCKSQIYPSGLPKASIVICFYNEHFETLMRSVHSILDRTQHKLLHEIILVDDYSDLENLHSQVKTAVEALNSDLRKEKKMLETNDIQDFSDEDSEDQVGGKGSDKKRKKGADAVTVKLLKTERREGLIRARLFGADNCSGEVLVFLDSHIEVNSDWLRPLLARLVASPTGAVMPIIDVINPDTFAYTPSPLVRGGFNWGLHFKWDNLPKGTLVTDEDYVKPIRSPTMAGGLFAIYKEYFNHIGRYDPGMDIWGGENLEISFRLWMCGGRLDIVPCSRVGHVFRKRRPYALHEKQDFMLRNSLRMAYVWMDKYIDRYIAQYPSVAKVSYGDVSERRALRDRLGCRSFQWYLDTVYPEMLKTDTAAPRKHLQPWHSRERNYTDSFQLRLTNSSLCIQSAKDIKTKGGGLVLAQCMRTLNQMFFQTARNELVLGRTLCLDATNNVAPSLNKCHELGGTQQWQHKGSMRDPLYNVAAGMCLGVERAYRNEQVIMTICTNTRTNQWDFVRS